MARRKATPQSAPSTLPEAIAIITRYLAIEAEIECLKTEADRSIATIQAWRDECVAPLKAETENLFLQLRAWWAVAAPDMTGGKRKSIELAGALIGERTTPPSLKLPQGMTAADAIREIFEWLGGEFIVTVNKLDKPAIIRALRAQPDEDDDANTIWHRQILSEKLGLAADQREEFFIDRAAPKEPDPDVVDVPAPAITEGAARPQAVTS